MVFCVELVMGVGPMNLVITNDALYQLSYYRVMLVLFANLLFFYHMSKNSYKSPVQ